jgi:hypothetical protein
VIDVFWALVILGSVFCLAVLFKRKWRCLILIEQVQTK